MGKAEVVPITERIAQSQKASAAERAWRVTKSLEGDRKRIEGLTWVEPEHDPQKGIRRRVDFSGYELPTERSHLMPISMDVSVLVPFDKIAPGEDFPQSGWTTPLMTRVSHAPEEIDPGVMRELYKGTEMRGSVRNTIDVVAMLPFPRTDASQDELFKPQFYVGLYVDGELGLDQTFVAVAKYGDKVIPQLLPGGDPHYLFLTAEEGFDTTYTAEMLTSLSEAELAKTPADAGTLEIYVSRYTLGKAPAKIPDYLTGGDLVTFPDFGGNDLGGGMRSTPQTFKPPSLVSLPGGGGQSTLPDPSQADAEVGAVKLGQGDRGQSITGRNVSIYPDADFGIQPVRIELLGVRETSSPTKVMGALGSIAARYD